VGYSRRCCRAFKQGSGKAMNQEKYIVSFTTGSLFHHESVTLAGLSLEHGQWQAVRDKVIKENILQARTLTSLERVCREVISRLKTLNTEELEYLTRAGHQEQGYLLWLAICRRYRFIADFAVEVVRERYITLKADLTHELFDSFFNHKSDWHPELEKIQPSTRKKLRQVLFRMLSEADLLTADNMIAPAMLSPDLIALISRGNRQELSFFPAFESDMKGTP
jgi:hypothetical protein